MGIKEKIGNRSFEGSGSEGGSGSGREGWEVEDEEWIWRRRRLWRRRHEGPAFKEEDEVRRRRCAGRFIEEMLRRSS